MVIFEVWFNHHPFSDGDIGQVRSYRHPFGVGDLYKLLNLTIILLVLKSFVDWSYLHPFRDGSLWSLWINYHPFGDSQLCSLILPSSFWCWQSLWFWSYRRPFVDDDLCKLFSIHLRVDIDLISYHNQLVFLTSLHFISVFRMINFGYFSI